MQCVLNSSEIAFLGLCLLAVLQGSKFESGEVRERTRLLVLQCLKKKSRCVLLCICACVCVQIKALEEAE